MGPDAEESLTHDDEHRNVEDEVRGQIMEVQPVVEHDTTDEWMEGKPQSMEEVVEEDYSLVRFRGRNDLPGSGQPMRDIRVKYPAPRSFLMCPSVTEEAIHLPPAPDMIGEG